MCDGPLPCSRKFSRSGLRPSVRTAPLVLVSLLAVATGALAQTAKDAPAPAAGQNGLSALRYVSLKADRVYLRKQCGRRRGDDDAYHLDEIEVSLYGGAGEKRVFRSAGAIWLGLEYGAQVWLPEVDPASFSVSRRI